MDVKRLRGYFAALAIITFVAMLLLLLQRAIPPENNDVFMVLLGALIAIVREVYSYYFGSSEGSHRKTELLSQKGDTNAP